MTGFENDILTCLQVLKEGGIFLYPTDTVWGIGCDATNETAVEKIYKLKRRTNSKTMIILLKDDKDILTYVPNPGRRVFDYLAGVSKPTTIIYERASGVAANLINADGTLGIRIVKDAFCKQLIVESGKPIVSTSANISGYPPAAIYPDIDMVIKNGVDYIVQHRQDDFYKAEPSSIVRWNTDGIPTIIRN